MKVDVINTVEGPTEKKIGSVGVTTKTDVRELLTGIANKTWGRGNFNVRKDGDYLFAFIAVNKDGDTIHLR